MMNETIIDNEELERCKNDKYYFFKKYVLINGKEPLLIWGHYKKTLQVDYLQLIPKQR